MSRSYGKPVDTSAADGRLGVAEAALPAAAADHGRVVRTLKDGYWDRTEVVQMADGSRRVRKSSKGDAPPGPWGVAALRREISYLSTLSEPARSVFPPLLAAWDDDALQPPAVGYEAPFYDDHVDAGELARAGKLSQAEVDEFQDALAVALLDKVYAETGTAELPLSQHVRAVVEQALTALEQDPQLSDFIGSATIQLNRLRVAGPRAAFARVVAELQGLAGLDAEPQVRLHGDCFLENILWRLDASIYSSAPRLVLIDPVSVAGVMWGPPLFDLVKYVSYARGELLALRSGWVDVFGFGQSGGNYGYTIQLQNPELQPFRARDWCGRLQRAFEHKYGPPNLKLYRVIDGYFSVAMAVNTSGAQRLVRLLKATEAFNAALT